MYFNNFLSDTGFRYLTGVSKLKNIRVGRATTAYMVCHYLTPMPLKTILIILTLGLSAP